MQNKLMYEVLSKSDNGKVVKNREKIFGEGEGNFEKKNENLQNADAK